MIKAKKILLISLLSLSFFSVFSQGEFKKVPNDSVRHDSDYLFGYNYVKNDSVLCQSIKKGNREIFNYAEQQPTFGDSLSYNNIRCYINRNLKLPTFCGSNEIEGYVFVRFVVEENGSLTNVEIIKGLYEMYDQEVLRMINEMPNWNAGVCGGKKVPVYYIIPVSINSR